MGPISSRMFAAEAKDLSTFARNLHERLLMEQIEHYKASKSPEVAQRGNETVNEYLSCITNTHSVSETFLKYLDLKQGEFNYEAISSKLKSSFLPINKF